MWTPKRVLLLVLGVVVFTTLYGIYAYFLGSVDGLPPLPAGYETRRIGPDPPPTGAETDADRKLKLAFGDDCPELRRSIKLEVRARGVVLAADQFTIIHGGPRDGQVQLEPFSVAVFGKSRGEGQFPEINTVRSDVAFLNFDEPIARIDDMGKHKIVGAELVCQVREGPDRSRMGPEGRVRITNNRRTPQRDDDFTLLTPGPVFYSEALHKIWTQEHVKLIDEQSKPIPTVVTANGMDVLLLTDEEDAKHKNDLAKKPGKDHKAKNGSNITGLRSVLLRSNVDMYLAVDGSSTFLGAPNKGAPAKAPDPAKGKTAAAPPHKDPVHIRTQGPFFYDAVAETARFDISQHPGPNPNYVEVTRRHEPSGALDQLNCSHLDLKLVRKAPAQNAPAPADDRGMDLDIESAHAWGDQVTLTSDAEGLTAFGNDLVHNTKTRESVLKGSPEMIALKDGNEIVARELVLFGVNGEKDTQQANAVGPGVVKMLNRQTGQRSQLARFQEAMLVTKEGKYDVLTLIGEASFEDLEHNQNLHGDRIKVWLEPGDAGPAAPQKAPADNDPSPQHRRPHHLEATGRVSAWSPGEMNVHDTDRLVVFFEDAPTPINAPAAAPVPVAANVVAQKPAPATAQAMPSVPAAPAAPQPKPTPAAAAQPAPAAVPAAKPADEKPKKPIDLRARSVEAHVRRTAEKNELERLWCEGDVRAFQEASGPEDDGSDVRGETLLLLAYPEGHVLTVTGDLAEVKLDKMKICGPEVNIDQKENKAWVNGLGSMRMPSDTSLTRGEKLTKPTELKVFWNRDMFFNGKYALFHGLDQGGVQAEQENGRLICQTMQVTLDRFVSLRQTNQKKGEPPAKVQKLVCDRSVRVEDRKYDEKDPQKLVSFQRLINPVLSVDNEDNIVVAPGPGEVRLLQLGAKDENQPGTMTAPPAPRRSSDPPAEEEMKLTRVTYLGRMFANNATRLAIFYDNVEVVHVPSDNPDLVLDPDKLPPGGLYVKSDQLKVWSRRDPSGTSHQEMEARGRALVQAQQFWGRADVIKYDESKELVIFESGPGSLATLYKIERPGEQPKEIRGKKIFYWRRTNDFKIEEGYRMIDTNTSTTTPRPKP